MGRRSAHSQDLITDRPASRDITSTTLQERQASRIDDAHKRWRDRERRGESDFGAAFMSLGFYVMSGKAKSSHDSLNLELLHLFGEKAVFVELEHFQSP